MPVASIYASWNYNYYNVLFLFIIIIIIIIIIISMIIIRVIWGIEKYRKVKRTKM